MKICIESQVLNHNRRSGLMTYAEGLINGLQASDTKDEFLLAYYSLSRKSSQMPGPIDPRFQKKVIRVPDREFAFRQKFIDKLALPIFFKNNKVDVFHRVNGYTMPQSSKIFKVLTVHDLRTLTIGDDVWAQNIDHYREALNSLDACVVVSECTKVDLLKHFQLDEKKIHVVYLGAHERFRQISKQDIQAVKDKYGIKERFLLSIGSVPRKNIDGILRAFAAAKASREYVLVLGCNIDVQKYKILASQLKISQQVIFLENLSDAEVVALYNGCHCFVFPSLYEGFGLPILEAMQCGAPVITSNMSSCPEVAADAAILVDPKNHLEIALAIDQVCFSDSLRNDLIIRGLNRSKMFNWGQYAIEMRQIYQLAASR